MKGDSKDANASSPGLYTPSLVLYAIGYITCATIGELTESAQPALIYLVPVLLAGSSLAALSTGQFKDMLQYKDPQPPEEDEATA